MAQAPRVGIEIVDQIIMRAMDEQLQFPPAVSRWKLLAWAAEEAHLQRTNPTDYQRGGFRRIFEEHFPTAARRP